MKIQIVTTFDVHINGGNAEDPAKLLELFKALAVRPEYFKQLAVPETYEARACDFEVQVTQLPHRIDDPLTDDQLEALIDGEGWIEVVVPIDAQEFVDVGGTDAFNALMDDRVLGGHGTLEDIGYTVAGVEKADSEEGVFLVRINARVAGRD